MSALIKNWISISVDNSKAFDTLSYSVLLRELVKYRLKRRLLDLEAREQVVNINRVFSTTKTVTFGVPQGTVLSS